jgi:hypothetical protein
MRRVWLALIVLTICGAIIGGGFVFIRLGSCNQHDGSLRFCSNGGPMAYWGVRTDDRWGSTCTHSVHGSWQGSHIEIQYLRFLPTYGGDPWGKGFLGVGVGYNWIAQGHKVLLHQTDLFVSIWTIGALLSFPAWRVLKRVRDRLRAGRLRDRGLCPSCTYDLTGNVSGVCPECGTSIPERSAEA